MEEEQKVKKFYTVKDIYNDNKQKLKIGKKRVTYKEFSIVIQTYFDLVFEDLFRFGDKVDISTLLISGRIGIRKQIQPRSYHVLKDNVASAAEGKLVFKKVPIECDWFAKLRWMRVIGSPRIKTVFSRVVNEKKKQFVKEVGWDNIIPLKSKKKKRNG